MEELECVSADEVSAAFYAWCKACPDGVYYFELVREFLRLMGISSFFSDQYRLSPQKAAMIRGMTGPHGYAYCKAIRMRLEHANQV